MLDIEPDQTVKYEVFITKKCDGNLRDLKKEKLTADHYSSMIKQMLSMLKHLKSLKKSHNDIKPGNVLFVKKKNKKATSTSLFDIHLKLADFGICNQSGGTPGWSPPDFTHDRVPGESDLYSVGLVILYLLCEDDELFYSIRDNYTEQGATWTNDFRQLPEIDLIRKMVNPLCKPTLESCEQQWQSLKIVLITRQRLLNIGVPKTFLHLQRGSVLERKKYVLYKLYFQF